MAKLLLLDGALLLTVVAAWREGLKRLEGQVLLAVAAFLVGPLLGVYGQTYQTGANSYVIYCLWFMLIVPWVAVARLPILAAGALALGNVAVLLTLSQLAGELPSAPLIMLLNGMTWILWEFAGWRVDWLDAPWMRDFLATMVLLPAVPTVLVVGLWPAPIVAIPLLLVLLGLLRLRGRWLELEGFPLALFLTTRACAQIVVLLRLVTGLGFQGTLVLVLLSAVTLQLVFKAKDHFGTLAGQPELPWYAELMALGGEGLAALFLVLPIAVLIGSEPFALLVVGGAAYLLALPIDRSTHTRSLGTTLSLAGLLLVAWATFSFTVGGFRLAPWVPYWLLDNPQFLLVPMCATEVLVAGWHKGFARRFLAVAVVGVALSWVIGLAWTTVAMVAVTVRLWVRLPVRLRDDSVPFGPIAVCLALALGLSLSTSASWGPSLVLCGGLALFARRVLRDNQIKLELGSRVAVGLASLLFVVATAQAPAIPAGLGLLVLGFHQSNRGITGLACAYLAFFGVTFYYGGGPTLLWKSIALGVVGLAILMVRQHLVGHLHWQALRRLNLRRRLVHYLSSAVERLRYELSSDGLRRSAPMVATLALALLLTGGLVVHKEIQIYRGQTVYLPLRPLDPRSLIQGDYMDLAYEFSRADAAWSEDGSMVLSLDSRQVGSYDRQYQGEQLSAEEVLLSYRLNAGRAVVGAESFFFQEGHGPAYAGARFAEVKITPEGHCVLQALCNANLERIDPR